MPASTLAKRRSQPDTTSRFYSKDQVIELGALPGPQGETVYVVAGGNEYRVGDAITNLDRLPDGGAFLTARVKGTDLFMPLRSVAAGTYRRLARVTPTSERKVHRPIDLGRVLYRRLAPRSTFSSPPPYSPAGLLAAVRARYDLAIVKGRLLAGTPTLADAAEMRPLAPLLIAEMTGQALAADCGHGPAWTVQSLDVLVCRDCAEAGKE